VPHSLNEFLLRTPGWTQIVFSPNSPPHAPAGLSAMLVPFFAPSTMYDSV
jgi:hypothetical protein